MFLQRLVNSFVLNCIKERARRSRALSFYGKIEKENMIYKETEMGKVVDFFWDNVDFDNTENVIGLSGNLGAGKTTFVKYLLKSLGVTQNVVSPTFVLRRDYEAGSRVQSPPRPSPSGREQGPQDREIVGYLTGDLKNFDSLHKFAIAMKTNPTEAEEFLWENLRRNKFGSRFRRQHVVGNFIVDFINIKNKLIIEVDGGVHNNLKERDNERTKVFNNLGFKVLRFINDQILTNINYVLSEIEGALAPTLKGRAGEGTIKQIIHIDAYRLETPSQIYQVISKEELADKNNLILIEWPELSENIFDKIFLFEHFSEDERKISIIKKVV